MKVEASLISEEDEGSGEGIVEALKKVVEVSKEVLKWVAGLLEDEAEDREEEGKMFLFCLRRLKTVTSRWCWSSVVSQSLWLENSTGGFLDQSRQRFSREGGFKVSGLFSCRRNWEEKKKKTK